MKNILCAKFVLVNASTNKPINNKTYVFNGDGEETREDLQNLLGIISLTVETVSKGKVTIAPVNAVLTPSSPAREEVECPDPEELVGEIAAYLKRPATAPAPAPTKEASLMELIRNAQGVLDDDDDDDECEDYDGADPVPTQRDLALERAADDLTKRILSAIVTNFTETLDGTDIPAALRSADIVKRVVEDNFSEAIGIACMEWLTEVVD